MMSQAGPYMDAITRSSAYGPATVETARKPRTILILVDQMCELGGGERTVFELAENLPRFGYRVLVATFRDQPNPECRRRLPGLIVLPVTSVFGRSGLHAAMELRRLIHKENVTLVQTFFESADTFGALACRIAGVKRIVSSRRDMGLLRSAKHRAAYRLLKPLHSLVLTVSEQVRHWHIQADHLRPHRVRTLYNGLPRDRFNRKDAPSSLRAGFGLPVAGKLVTTVANINAWKGLDTFLRAAAIVQRYLPTTQFAIAGEWTDEVLTARLRNLAHELGIERNVHFMGRVEDVPGLLLASDAFALLSRSEGFPNVVLEAMAATLPVVATAVGGTPEAMVDGETGFLVRPDDPIAAANVLLLFLRDQRVAARFGACGRRLVFSQFSLERMVSQYAEVYDELLD